jgi:hypothetical protein
MPTIADINNDRAKANNFILKNKPVSTVTLVNTVILKRIPCTLATELQPSKKDNKEELTNTKAEEIE